MAKQIGSQYDFQQIPILGLVAEQKATAPTTPSGSPKNGQLWYDTTNNCTKVYDNGTWTLIANAAVGGTTPIGPAGAGGGDLTGTYPDPSIKTSAITTAKILDGTILLTDMDPTASNAAAGTPSLRKLGTGATDAAAGTDSRFTDSRAPTGAAGGDLTGSTYPNPVIANDKITTAKILDANVTLAKMATGSVNGNKIVADSVDNIHILNLAVTTGKIADANVTLAKMAPNSVDTSKIVDGTLVSTDFAAAYLDGAAGTAMLRSLGFGAQQAMPGNTKLNDMNGTNVPNGPIPMGGQRLTGLADGTSATDAATKGQLDSVAAGLDPKASVKVATTVALTAGVGGNAGAGGSITVDGYVTGAGDRVLIKNQANPAENGIYVTNTGGTWGRANDFDAWAEVPGAYVFVEQGTANADSGWVCTADQGGTMLTTAITWAKFSQAGQVIDGAGLLMTGNQLDVGQGNGIVVGTDSISVSWGGNGSATSSSRSDHNHDTTYAPLTRTISTTAPLTGGGDLSANRTLAINNYSGGANTGVVPVGGTATTYLRGDGTWVTPPAGTTLKFAGLVGALVAGVETLLTHSLGTQDVIASFRDASTNKAIDFDWRAASTTQIGITADIAYSANAIRAVVIG